MTTTPARPITSFTPAELDALPVGATFHDASDPVHRREEQAIVKVADNRWAYLGDRYASVDLDWARGHAYALDERSVHSAVRDVLAELAGQELRDEGTRDGQLPDLVGRLLNPDRPDKSQHPRSRLVLCAAFLLAEIERLDRATTPSEAR
jgi:hypothetical protein